MKLLITTSTLPRWPNDNTPAFVSDFAKSLSGDFEEIQLLAPHYVGAKKREQTANIKTTRYRYFLPYSWQNIAYEGGAHTRISKNPLYIAKLLSLIASQFLHILYYVVFKKYRVINAHWLIPQGFIAVIVKIMLLNRLKVVVTVHGSDVFKLEGKLLRKIKCFTLKHADRVVVNSSVTLAKCRDIYQRDYDLVPMGISVNNYRKGNAKRIRVMHKLGGDFVILFVGRFSEEKGIKFLCQAILELKKNKDLKFKAILVGDGPEREEITTFIHTHRLEKIIITPGWVSPSELKDYYSAADVFVGPSVREALGLVFIEALASGTPIIATKTGGIKDVLVDGMNGYAVRSGSADDIVNKVQLLINDPRVLKRITQGAQEGIIDNYSWKTVSDRYIKIMT